MTTKPMSHIFKEADEAKTKEEKIKILRDNLSKAMVNTLLAAYDDRVKWTLPEGDPPYKPSTLEASLLAGNYYQKTRSFYLFVELEGEPKVETRFGVKERAFVEILESIHPDDAKMLLKIKNKEWLGATLSPELIQEAFPDMILKKGKDSAPATVPTVKLAAKPAPAQEATVKRGRGRPKKAA